MFECACRSDLTLSRERAPEDPAAHCAAYAERAVEMANRPEDEQKRSPLLLAAPDVSPGSFLIFSVALPCLVDAMKSKAKIHGLACNCAAHAIANRIARRKDLGLQSEYVIELGDELNALRATGQCRPMDDP